MLELPDDLLIYLDIFLKNEQRKTLRLVNKRLHSLISLAIPRVFISPSYKNIEVFQAIAAHPVLRKQVKEIIWDDARFEKFDSDDDDQSETLPDERLRNKYVFWEEINEIEPMMGGRDDCTYPRLTELDVMSLDESFELYSRLYEEQEIIIQQELDIEAFRNGLASFTGLERVTITSEAYRPNIADPCYPTPLIRSFPIGFRYPCPWPWMPESMDAANLELDLEDIRIHWRGFTLVLSALAQSERLVPELVIDSRYEAVGIAYQLFDHISHELHSLEALCERGLRRLDLAINTLPYYENPGLEQLPRGHLKSVLAKAASLEHFSLHTDSGPEAAWSFHPMGTDLETMHVLRAIPLDFWRHLKHITLSSIPVTYSDLINFLQRLPKDIRHVELINVSFLEKSIKEFLEDCRDVLRWRAEEPELSIAYQEGGVYDSRKFWVQEDIARFFEGGDNPFAGQYNENVMLPGFGATRDDFDPDFYEPFLADPYVFISPGVYRRKTRDELAEEDRVQK